MTAGIEQVVIFSAGLDTKAYRLVAPRGGTAFEVDQPANSIYKQHQLHTLYGWVPTCVALIPVDFETDDLTEALTRHVFQIKAPTLFVWEAVTQYLTESGVHKTFGLLAQAVPGSRPIFTYVRKDFLDDTHRYGAERLYQDNVLKQQFWRFGLAPEQVAGLLQQYGWAEREQVGRAAVRRTDQSGSRDLGAQALRPLGL